MSTKNNIFIGIDVSKASLDISMAGKHIKIINNSDNISDFIKSEILSKNIMPTLVCLESTGGYEKAALQAFHDAGIAIHKAHPNKVHSFAKASGHFAKTDKLDSKLLEKYASFIAHQEKGDDVVPQSVLELQELRNVERNLMDNLHVLQCRLQHIKNRGAKYLNKQIAFIKTELELIRKEINNLIDSDDNLNKKKTIIKSYKGVGDQVSNTMLAELPELGNLNKKEIASLVGVAPKLAHSGVKAPNGHIFGGRFYVRKALYMSALVASRHNEKMKSFYHKLIMRGKAKKIAITAVMRKIIVTLNSMLKNNTIYA